MPEGYQGPDGKPDIKQLKTKIAVIQDQDYPEGDHLSPVKDLTVKFRKEGYRRHTFQGQNVFLVEMANQFNDVFGLRLANYETLSYDAQFTIDNYVSQARRDTAEIAVSDYAVKNGTLKASVTIRNKTGHRFPSGVGFRRAFIAFEVYQANPDSRTRLLWASGRTNSVGALVGADGKILPTEFFTGTVAKGNTAYTHQPHWEVIDSEEKVQIYEELSKNAKGEYTTSFIHRDCEVKDNRLLPKGWTVEGPNTAIPKAFLEATYPGHEAAKDPAYQDGRGTDTVTYSVKLPKGTDPATLFVKATLYFQAWAPYYLNQRFTKVPKEGSQGLARRRLYYLTSNLQTRGTAVEDWKFRLVSDVYPGDSAAAKAMAQKDRNTGGG